MGMRQHAGVELSVRDLAQILKPQRDQIYGSKGNDAAGEVAEGSVVRSLTLPPDQEASELVVPRVGPRAPAAGPLRLSLARSDRVPELRPEGDHSARPSADCTKTRWAARRCRFGAAKIVNNTRTHSFWLRKPAPILWPSRRTGRRGSGPRRLEPLRGARGVPTGTRTPIPRLKISNPEPLRRWRPDARALASPRGFEPQSRD